RLVELLKQPLNSPMPVQEQVVSIYAGTKGFLDDVPVGDVRRFESELLDQMRSTHGSLLDDIAGGAVPDDLDDAIKQFKQQFTLTGADRPGVDPTKTAAEELEAAKSQKTLATE
ncbi:MAG: F0F1 ATP synthase subunit alpha, partial [Ilumatobacteraceae bacterium]